MRKLLLSIMLMSALIGESWAQDRTLSGKVTAAEDGSTLPGVTVIIKGTTNGTTSDLDGNWKLGVPQEGGILVFSFVGMASQEVEIGNRSVIDLAMEADAKQLNEVVITSFGMAREKKALGYAVQELQAKDLVQSQTRSAIQAFQGKVAGVQITNASGAPGASTNIVLRGTSSLTGNNGALFIVDGVPVNNVNNNNGGVLTGAVDGGNAINDINPEDIASISILKGASAAALYGSRAANGVVIISTKKGKDTQGRINVEFNSSYTFERVLMLPELQNQFGQGQQGDNIGFLNDQESWGDELDGSLRPYGAVIGDRNSPFFGQQRVKPYVALPDNNREYFDIGGMFTNSVALSGGNESANFRISISDLSQTGVIPNTELDRNTFSLGGSAKMNDKLDFSANVNIVRQTQDLAINGQGGESPYAQVLQSSRSISLVEQRDLNNIYNGVDWYYTPFIQNPYFNLQNDSYDKQLNRFYGSFAINYKPIDILTLTARVGTDVSNDDRKRVKQRRIASALSANSGANELGFVQDEAYTNRQVDANFIATINKDIIPNLNANFLVGYNYNQRAARAFFANVNQTSIPGFGNISNGAVNPSVSEANSLRKLMGAYTQLDLSYKGFLFLGATYRQDWSSTLPLQNNSFGYPSVNTSIVLTDAFDLGIENILTFAKIRASYAEVGNDAPPYRTSSVFFAPQTGFGIAGNFGSVDFPLNGVAGFTEGNTIGNSGLKPERTKEFEIGADFRFVNNRIGLDIAYFSKVSEDQIVTAAAPPSSGFSFQVLNAGTMENKGWEVLLRGTPVKTNDLTVELLANFTKIDNEITSLPNGDITIGVGLANFPQKAIEGQPYGIFEAPTALRTPEGQLILDGNGLPQQAPAPAQFGSVQADWLGGATINVNFKNFSFSATVDHKEGGKVYSNTVSQIYFNGTATETAFNNRERFIVPGVVDNGDGTFSPNTSVLTMASNNIRQYWNAINGFGEYLIFDASYTKLREMSLSYELPKALLDKTFIGTASVSIYGRNLWIHTPDRNTYIDPEVNSFTGGNTNNGNLTGYEFGTTPSTSTYGMSLRVTL